MMKTILIVGGGAAGLSAGIYAQMNGYRARICEKQQTAGGCLSFWQREGCRIDNCIHWLSGTNEHTELNKIWRELGALGDTAVVYKPALYTAVLGNRSLSLDRDLQKLQNDMLSLSPRDAREIRSFIRSVEAVEGWMGIAGKAHDESFSRAKLIGRLPDLLKYYRLSLNDLARRFQHPLLREFFVSFLPEDFNALSLVITAADFCADNAGLPAGGTEGVAKRMTERFLSLGGTVEYGKEAVSIRANGRNVRSVAFSDGTEYQADHYILTPDPAVIFGRMTDRPMPSALAAQYRKRKRFSAVHCAFLCDAPSLPFENDQTLPVPDEYRAVLPCRFVQMRYEGRGSCAPEGKSLLQTMLYCDEATAVSCIETRNRSREEYQKRKKETADAVGKVVAGQFPFLEGKMRAVDVWTPATYRRFLGTQTGSFMSFAFPPRRFPKELKNEVDSLDNLMLAGQWLRMPGGLPIAVCSGKNAVMRIVKKDRPPRGEA